MDKKQLLQVCIDDRFRHMKQNNFNIPLSKKLNIDLLAKFIILLVNSVGLRRSEEIIFVDEVKNSSMITSIKNTMEECPYEYCVLNFRTFERNKHVRIGCVYPLYLILRSCLYHLLIFLLIPFAGKEKVNEMSSRKLITFFNLYLSKLDCDGKHMKAYCMTDHNFYSTIVCTNKKFESYVIQHGLILTVDYYYPIYADHFLAWGEHSYHLLPDPQKALITGTYKFSKLKELRQKTDDRVLLYCISILDDEKVNKKIDDLLSMLSYLNMKLAVKMHPGSFYSISDLEKKYGGENAVRFYKECALADIDFDVAVIENSTILLDLCYLGKPFIIFDDEKGYFDAYDYKVPHAFTKEELVSELEHQNADSYSYFKSVVIEKELNGGQCNIFSIAVDST